MNLYLNPNIASSYTSGAQISRVLTETWVEQNLYCPSCGSNNIDRHSNNSPVADFFCINCDEEYELKSKNGKLGTKIVDGAYRTMIERITAQNNPNFFFLTYNKNDWSVTNFILIPKHFFVPDIIEQRRPLSETARRAGWTGCNIDLKKIPQLGYVFIIKNSTIISKNEVIAQLGKSTFLKNNSIEVKGWTLDILKCIDSLQSKTFSIQEIYDFEKLLKLKHPDNNFIKDKIRQQLQYLRDKGIIEFVSKGNYRKL